jgi:hypothetical protein
VQLSQRPFEAAIFCPHQPIAVVHSQVQESQKQREFVDKNVLDSKVLYFLVYFVWLLHVK